MPAKSKKQQRFFGMVHAAQKGELKDASSEVKKVAKDIDPEDAGDFAATKHKGLPEKKTGGKKEHTMWETFKQFKEDMSECSCQCKSCVDGDCAGCTCEDCDCDGCSC
jgi:hypothetical protein